jgi:hypothetical protein
VTTHQGHLQTQATEPEEYLIKIGKIIAQTISAMNHQFAQTYSLIKNIKVFGKKKCQAAHKELKQLHNHIVFKLILIENLTANKRICVMESLIFLTEKKDRKIKARTCANGNIQHKYTKRNKAASSMVMTESHLITAVINAKQRHDIMTANILQAFVQMDTKAKPSSEQIIMKI